jgi:hypothetical protein
MATATATIGPITAIPTTGPTTAILTTGHITAIPTTGRITTSTATSDPPQPWTDRGLLSVPAGRQPFFLQSPRI